MLSALFPLEYFYSLRYEQNILTNRTAEKLTSASAQRGMNTSGQHYFLMY